MGLYIDLSIYCIPTSASYVCLCTFMVECFSLMFSLTANMQKNYTQQTKEENRMEFD